MPTSVCRATPAICPTHDQPCGRSLRLAHEFEAVAATMPHP